MESRMIDQVEKFIVRNHDLTMKWIRLPKTDQLEVLHLIYQHTFGCCSSIPAKILEEQFFRFPHPAVPSTLPMKKFKTKKSPL